MKIECTPTGTWIVRQSYKGQSLVSIAPSRAEALGAMIDLIDAHRRISTPSEAVAQPSEAVAHLCEEEKSRAAEHCRRLAKEAEEQKLIEAGLATRESALRFFQEAASRLKNIENPEGEK